MFERKKVGLALSSGGIKGLAHIGVLKILEDCNIPIDFIAGTSIGSIIGALYSAEPNAKKLEKEVLNLKINNLFDYTLCKSGFIKGEKIENYIKQQLNDVSFKDLKIPLFITAFDLENKREVIFSKGNVAKAVRASISIPGVFIPVINNNRILVDGGLIDPIPTEVLKKAGAQIIIAVNVNTLKIKSSIFNEEATVNKSAKQLPHVLETAVKSLEITGYSVAKADLASEDADLVINIDAGGMLLFEAKNPAISQKIINLGKSAARKEISKIKDLTESNPLKQLLEQIHQIPDKTLNVKKIVKKVEQTIKN